MKKLNQFILPERKEFINLEYDRITPVMPKIKEPLIDFKTLNKKK
jgi:hypothetical protein